MRAAVLALLSGGWALAAHRWAAGPGHEPGPWVVPLLWAATATGLLAWWMLPLCRRPGQRWAALAGLLLLGQLLGHAALSLAPLLAAPPTGARSAGAGAPPDHHPVVGRAGPALGPEQVLAALAHASGGMLLAHLLAGAAAAAAWTVGGILWRATLRWLSAVLAAAPHVRPVLPRLVPCPVAQAPRSPRVLSWDGRAPPRAA